MKGSSKYIDFMKVPAKIKTFDNVSYITGCHLIATIWSSTTRHSKAFNNWHTTTSVRQTSLSNSVYIRIISCVPI